MLCACGGAIASAQRVCCDRKEEGWVKERNWAGSFKLVRDGVEGRVMIALLVGGPSSLHRARSLGGAPT